MKKTYLKFYKTVTKLLRAIADYQGQVRSRSEARKDKKQHAWVPRGACYRRIPRDNIDAIMEEITKLRVDEYRDDRLKKFIDALERRKGDYLAHRNEFLVTAFTDLADIKSPEAWEAWRWLESSLLHGQLHHPARHNKGKLKDATQLCIIRPAKIDVHTRCGGHSQMGRIILDVSDVDAVQRMINKLPGYRRIMLVTDCMAVLRYLE